MNAEARSATWAAEISAPLFDSNHKTEGSEQVFRASRTRRYQSWSREAPASWTPANESIQIDLMKKQRIVSEPPLIGSTLGFAILYGTI